jgi:hypothetical protein
MEINLVAVIFLERILEAAAEVAAAEAALSQEP